MEITKGWKPNKQFKLLEERASRIQENQDKIQVIEGQWTQKENILTPSCSQGVDQLNSPVASHHSKSSKFVAKNHHYSKFQGVSRRRQGIKGKNKNTFIQRKKEADSIIQRLLDLV
ncbi:hypothetical protein O181_035438 [Austropuccinia psidii MF-1]|uniref:Uncharacterized protein n=1 Tax=Austropuccinia psidii MF-1 TaxID=1389203 RepID=A0A9Q3D5G8_9BASI|nr:hypothetical protein [Austropuccinia psidii MF-1]